MGKIDEIAELASRLGGQAPQPKYLKMRDAAEAVYAGERAGWRMAEDLLHRYPDSLDKIDQFVGDHGMQLGRPVGAGAESLVWELQPALDAPPQVLKVRTGDAEIGDFNFPDNVPGIAPYWARSQAGPNVAVALQPRADVVYRPVQGWEKTFQNAAERVKESLLARGVYWADGHQYNLGVMPDGQWSAIDGFMYDAHPAWTKPNISPEEAIRMLRLTADEQAAIYGQAP